MTRFVFQLDAAARIPNVCEGVGHLAQSRAAVGSVKRNSSIAKESGRSLRSEPYTYHTIKGSSPRYVFA